MPEFSQKSISLVKIEKWLKSNAEGVFNDVRFVAIWGNDATGSGTWDAPYQTIEMAIANSRQKDVVVVLPGTYQLHTPLMIPGQIQVIGCGITTILKSMVCPMVRMNGDSSVFKSFSLVKFGIAACIGVEVNGVGNLVKDIKYLSANDALANFPAEIVAYTESFDSTAEGAIPQDWYKDGNIGIFTVTAAESVSAPNSLQADGGVNGRLQRKIPAGQTLAMNVKAFLPGATGTPVIGFTEYVGTRQQNILDMLTIRFGTDVIVTYGAGLQANAIPHYVSNTWFNLEIIVGTTTFSVRIDGVPVALATNVPFSGNGLVINAMRVNVPFGGNQIYIDDVTITGTIEGTNNTITECVALNNGGGIGPAIYVDQSFAKVSQNVLIANTGVTGIEIGRFQENNLIEYNTIVPSVALPVGINILGDYNTIQGNTIGCLVTLPIQDLGTNNNLIMNHVDSIVNPGNTIEQDVGLIANNLAGTTTSSTTTANWNAAEADIVSIGSDNVRNKIHSLFISLNTITAASLITVRMYKQVNGTERKFFDETYTKGTDPDGVPLIDGTIGVSEVIRVTAQSNTAADDGKAIAYDFVMEAM